MSLEIHLLGRPWAKSAGVPLPQPRGRKAWALLAYLALSERAVPRAHLASLLFPEADDPLGALRWNLAELRRLLGDPAALKGERIALALPPGSYVDVRVLTSATSREASAVPGLGEELLAGYDLESSPGFDAWLINERRRMMASSAAALREATLVRLSSGDAEEACALAARLVVLEPLDENSQALLIRSYVAIGDEGAAARQLAGCIELFRRELGVDPGPVVTAAIRSGHQAWRSMPRSGAATARGQLDAGLAALKAGVLDAGVECLARAATEADASGDAALKVRAMFELGSALVHSGKNRFEEGAAVLHELLHFVEEHDDQTLRAGAMREIAWAELLAARYQRCETWLHRALEAAAGDDVETAAALRVLGLDLMEVGRYGESMQRLRRAVELADATGNTKEGGIARAVLGKALVMRRELDEARVHLERSIETIRGGGWTVVLPWPEAYLGELEFHAGDLDRAQDLLDHAFTLAGEISDPCFLTKSEANIGLLEAARGNLDTALRRLESARLWMVKTPDHTWTHAYAIDASCIVGVSRGLDETSRWINDLEIIGGRTGMREFVARAYVHRHNLRRRAADLEAAAAIAAEIDNPYLQELVRTPDMARI